MVLRSRQVEFEFVASDRYRVRDMRTDTVLAERSYNGELALDYQGIQLTLDNPAKVGDSFVIDGNNFGPMVPSMRRVTTSTFCVWSISSPRAFWTAGLH